MFPWFLLSFQIKVYGKWVQGCTKYERTEQTNEQTDTKTGKLVLLLN